MNDGIVDTLAEVATRFRKSLRTAQRWMRAGAPRLSDGSYDLAEIERWIKQSRKGGGFSHRGPSYGYCRARLGELVNPKAQTLLLAGLSDVEVGLSTMARALAVHGDVTEELRKLVLFFLQVLAKPLLHQIGSTCGSFSGHELQLQLKVLE